MSWAYFSYSSDPMMRCPCCLQECMNDNFMKKLDVIRTKVMFPIRLTSGYRCPHYNSIISTTGRTGAHTTGRAADIHVTDSRKRFMIVESAIDLGITRIGKYSTFIHLDDLTESDGFPVDVMW